MGLTTWSWVSCGEINTHRWRSVYRNVCKPSAFSNLSQHHWARARTRDERCRGGSVRRSVQQGSGWLLPNEICKGSDSMINFQFSHSDCCGSALWTVSSSISRPPPVDSPYVNELPEVSLTQRAGETSHIPTLVIRHPSPPSLRL